MVIRKKQCIHTPSPPPMLAHGIRSNEIDAWRGLGFQLRYLSPILNALLLHSLVNIKCSLALSLCFPQFSSETPQEERLQLQNLTKKKIKFQFKKTTYKLYTERG